MKLLVMDTCGAEGTLALVEQEARGVPASVLGTAVLPGRTASERLVPAISRLVADCGMSLPSVGAIAVVHGPGSFTGVRVGLSAAKGLCEALAIPLVAVSRLAVMVRMACAVEASGRRVYVFLDAGRGEFYCGEYMDGVCVRESLVTLETARTVGADGDAAVVCEANVAEALESLAPMLLPPPTAIDAVPLVVRRVREGSFDDVATIDANYVRRTDAEIFAKPKAASA